MTAEPTKVEATNIWLSSYGARIGASGCNLPLPKPTSKRRSPGFTRIAAPRTLGNNDAALEKHAPKSFLQRGQRCPVNSDYQRASRARQVNGASGGRRLYRGCFPEIERMRMMGLLSPPDTAEAA